MSLLTLMSDAHNTIHYPKLVRQVPLLLHPLEAFFFILEDIQENV